MDFDINYEFYYYKAGSLNFLESDCLNIYLLFCCWFPKELLNSFF